MRALPQVQADDVDGDGIRLPRRDDDDDDAMSYYVPGMLGDACGLVIGVLLLLVLIRAADRG